MVSALKGRWELYQLRCAGGFTESREGPQRGFGDVKRARKGNQRWVKREARRAQPRHRWRAVLYPHRGSAGSVPAAASPARWGLGWDPQHSPVPAALCSLLGTERDAAVPVPG